ncbi:MAG: hypothetical protein ACREL3_02245 [Gemmatimonadales bacterium]
MVILGRGDRQGTSSFGCLISIMILAAAVYYGIHVGQVYFRYYQLQDEMESAARMAPSLKDDVIYRRLAATSDSLLGRTLTFDIKRTNRITIHTEYSDSVDLPLFKHTFHFKPRVEEPL